MSSWQQQQNCGIWKRPIRFNVWDRDGKMYVLVEVHDSDGRHFLTEDGDHFVYCQDKYHFLIPSLRLAFTTQDPASVASAQLSKIIKPPF